MNTLATRSTLPTTPPAWRKHAILGGAAIALVGAGALGGVLLSRPAVPTAQDEVPLAAAPLAAPAATPAKKGELPAPVRSTRAGNGAVAGTGSATTPLATEPAVAAAPVCASCGVVESVETVVHKGEGSGVGAVAGGVIGGLLGNQMGGGNGRKAMTVIGAVGGGMAGHEIEKRQKSTTHYRVTVRMDDGSRRTVERAQSVAAGTRVTVDGQKLSVRQESSGAAPAPGRLLQTGAQQS